MRHLARELRERDVLFLQTILIPGLPTRYVTQRPKQSNCQAWNMHVMRLALPRGLRNRQAAGRLAQDQIAAVRAHVEERPDLSSDRAR